MTDQDHAKIVREALETQADREAAAQLYTLGLIYAGSYEGSAKVAQRILDGKEDKRSTVQMFTTFRLAAEAAAFEKAAGVAGSMSGFTGCNPDNVSGYIATAIRKLAGETHD